MAKYAQKDNKYDIYDFINDNVLLIEVAKKLGLKLHKAGTKFQGNCPTGHSSTSEHCFTIFSTNFFCFNCSESGDAVRLVEIAKKLSNSEAIDWLITEFNLEQKLKQNKFKFNTLSESEKLELSKQKLKASLYQEAYSWMHEQLFQEHAGEELAYLTKKRKYNLEDIKNSEWCYFPKEVEIRNYLKSKFPEQALEINALAFRGQKEDFSHLAFPYRDSKGMITGFIKRSILPEGIDINGKLCRWDSTYGISKKDMFNLYNCKTQESIVLLEGYPDALMFPLLGMENICAVGQGNLSVAHLEELQKSKIKYVTIAFDNDKVGPDNTEKAVRLLLDETNIIPFVLEPTLMGINHKDPDEYVKANGMDEFKNLLKKSESGLVWLCKRITDNLNAKDPIEKDRCLKECIELISKTKTVYDKENCINIISTAFGIKAKAVNEMVSGQLKKDKVFKYAQNRVNEEERYFPFIERKTSQYAYYDRVKDEIHLGVNKEILSTILASAGQEFPEVPFVLSAEFDVKSNERISLNEEQINLFVPSEYMLMEKTEQQINPYKSFPHIYKLLSNIIPDYQERKLFLNWLTGILQTREKQLTAWVFKGEQGAGKGLLLNMVLKELFGRRQVVQVEDQQLQNEFNPWLQNTLLIAFNEVASNNQMRNSINSKLKAIITDSEIQINEKQVRQFYLRNYVNCIFFSNETIPVFIEANDRRYNVVETKGNINQNIWFRENPDLFIEQLKEELPVFAQFLMNWKYDPNKARRVIRNNTKEIMISSGKSKFEEFVHALRTTDIEWFEEYGELTSPFDDVKESIKQKKVEKRSLRDLFVKIYGNEIPEVSLGKKLAELGIRSVRVGNPKKPYYTWD
ncbi:MAG TPA: DUF5906 domain-containing protein [Ignavibacteriaceae bacterium]|nr:DUF5906 domain-containing protein [Ignavibacteriaceae bacterium]